MGLVSVPVNHMIAMTHVHLCGDGHIILSGIHQRNVRQGSRDSTGTCYCLCFPVVMTRILAVFPSFCFTNLLRYHRRN
jgi:hypothetical protein